MIVVDASVAVKWFIPEPGEEDAGKLLSGTQQLIAPALIRLEVTGALIRRFREGHLTEQRAREGAQTWETMLRNRILHLIPDAELYDDAVQLAFLARHTLADCLYLAAAKRLDTAVITADQPMHDRGIRAYSKIEFLGGTQMN